MNEKQLKLLYDVKLLIDEIDSYFQIESKTFDNYKSNAILRRAIGRTLEIIGEAMNRILREDIPSQLKMPSGLLASGTK